jgi:hypothetical protein
LTPQKIDDKISKINIIQENIMSRISINLDEIIVKAEKTVASHKIGKGNYARWLWQNAKNDRQLGSNPYGLADAANILYMTGSFPQDDEERAEFVKNLRSFQDPETGLFNENTHHTYHTTAHCTAALELFDKEWPTDATHTIRLIGFGVTNFTGIEEREEPSLFPSELAISMEKRERLSSILDKLPPSVKPGTAI